MEYLMEDGRLWDCTKCNRTFYRSGDRTVASDHDCTRLPPLCSICHENEALWLDTVRGELLSDGSVSDGAGEYLSVCLDCYDEGKS